MLELEEGAAASAKGKAKGNKGEARLTGVDTECHGNTRPGPAVTSGGLPRSSWSVTEGS